MTVKKINNTTQVVRTLETGKSKSQEVIKEINRKSSWSEALDHFPVPPPKKTFSSDQSN
jgi:hypothetical protein